MKSWHAEKAEGPLENDDGDVKITSISLYPQDFEGIDLIRGYMRATNMNPFGRSRTAAIRYAIRRTVQALATEIRSYNKRFRNGRRRKKKPVPIEAGET
jgi:hypothetical protein